MGLLAAGTIPSAREVIEITGGKLFFPHERARELAPHLLWHWAAPEPGAEPRRSDLMDGLCDALDEYAVGAIDLPTLVRDVDLVIVELAPLSDPIWVGKLRDQWRTLSSQIERIEPATTALRRLLTAQPATV